MTKVMEKYSSYKDSGVKWLGEIPSHWETACLGKKCKFSKGLQFTKSDLIEEGLPVVSYGQVHAKNNTRTHISEELVRFVPISFAEGHDNAKVKIGEFIVADTSEDIEGSGNMAYNDCMETLYGGYHTILIKDLCFENKKYLAYLFNSVSWRSQIRSLVNGVKVYTISREFLKQSVILYPPKSEQDAIVSYLDSVTTQIDVAIEQQKKMIVLLNERKQIIINNAVTKGLDPNVKMKDSGVDWIGEIPEGWEVKKLKHVCQAFGRIGFRGYSTTDLVDEGDGCITLSPSNMRDGHMQYDKCTYLSWEKYEESPEIKIFDGDILFVKTGSTYGKSSFVQDLPQEATINPQLLVFKEVRCFNEFLAYILQSNFIKNQVEVSVIGGTIPTISQTKILNYVFPYPSIKEQKSIVLYIKEKSAPVNEAIKNAERQISLLQERKQIIINEVVTGKVKVE